MKKFAALFIGVMLVALMVVAPVVSATVAKDFSDAITLNGSNKGTLTLNKYQAVPDKTTEADPKATDPATGEKLQPAVSGATFTAYRIYDLSNAGLFSVNTKFDAVSQLKDYLDKDSNLTYNSTADLEGIIPTLQKTASTLSKDDVNVFEATDKPANNGVYKFGALPLGIYLVVETVVPENYAVSSVPFLAAIPEWDEANSKWNFDITANPKDDYIKLDKVITNSDDVDPVKDVKSATKDIGDKVAYKVTADLPYYGKLSAAQKDAIVYTFVDTMSKGLTYNGDFAAKVINDKVTPKIDYTVPTDKYKVVPNTNDDGSTTITVKFDWNALDAYQGQDITITYSATINDKAAAGTVNKNVAKIKYTNNARPNNSGVEGGDPNDDPIPDPEKDTKETPESETKVYVYELNLTKTFNGLSVDEYNKTVSADGKISAAGVKFTLTVKDETVKDETSPIEFIKESDGVYRVCGDNVPKTGAVTELSPKANGDLVLRGLDEGTYVLSEVSSIEGWSKLASDIEITLVGAKGTDGLYNGLLASAAANPGGALKVNEATVSGINGHFDITVNNVQKQFDLPLTGGAGLLMFTIGGGIVIAGAIIIFSSLRKKNIAE